MLSKSSVPQHGAIILNPIFNELIFFYKFIKSLYFLYTRMKAVK